MDGAPDPSVPGEKTFPRRQPEGSKTTPMTALRGTRCGAIVHARLRGRRGKAPTAELLFPHGGL